MAFMALIIVAGMLAALNACGGGAGQTFNVPTGPANMSGTYHGTATNPASGASIVIQVRLLETEELLEAGLSYPDDEAVAEVFGEGSRNGGSFSVIMNMETGREFYFEGTVSASGEINATIHYPDHSETLTVWALLQPAV